MGPVGDMDSNFLCFSAGFKKSLSVFYYLFVLQVQFLDSVRQSHPSISLLFLNTVVKNIQVSLNPKEKKK